MRQLNLIEGEEFIEAFFNGDLLLTNLRLRYDKKNSLEGQLTSMFLTNLASIELTYTSNPWFILMGIVLGLLSLFLGWSYSGFLFLLGGAISIIPFLMFKKSRIQYLIIKSKGGGLIKIQKKGSSVEKIRQLIDQVESFQFKASRI